jgi:hypothetical protein
MKRRRRPAVQSPPVLISARIDAKETPWNRPARGPEDSMANTDLSRILGGSPGSVLLKLIFMSIVVGAFLSLFGLTPPDLLRGAKELLDRIMDLGFGAVRQVLRYFVYGAMIVVPVWLLMRLFGR